MREDKPRVSIITPTYNREGFIGEAVESVLSQTFADFELLIVDDGSTDSTEERLTPYREDPRVKYFQQENQGQSIARNLALQHAQGEFICFLDSDNAWVPDKLEKQLAVFERTPEVEVVYGDIITIDESGNELSRDNMARHSGFVAFQMLKDNFVSMNTAMARRRCFDELGGMGGKRRVADDYDLWLRFSARYRFRYIPEYFAYYRVMGDQISSDKSGRFESNEAIIHDFRRQFPDVLPKAQFDEAFAFFYARKARYLAGVGRRGQALRSILTALSYRPFYKAPWRSLAAVILKGRP